MFEYLVLNDKQNGVVEFIQLASITNIRLYGDNLIISLSDKTKYFTISEETTKAIIEVFAPLSYPVEVTKKDA